MKMLFKCASTAVREGVLQLTGLALELALGRRLAGDVEMSSLNNYIVLI